MNSVFKKNSRSLPTIMMVGLLSAFFSGLSRAATNVSSSTGQTLSFGGSFTLKTADNQLWFTLNPGQANAGTTAPVASGSATVFQLMSANADTTGGIAQYGAMVTIMLPSNGLYITMTPPGKPGSIRNNTKAPAAWEKLRFIPVSGKPGDQIKDGDVVYVARPDGSMTDYLRIDSPTSVMTTINISQATKLIINVASQLGMAGGLATAQAFGFVPLANGVSGAPLINVASQPGAVGALATAQAFGFVPLANNVSGAPQNQQVLQQLIMQAQQSLEQAVKLEKQMNQIQQMVQSSLSQAATLEQQSMQAFTMGQQLLMQAMNQAQQRHAAQALTQAAQAAKPAAVALPVPTGAGAVPAAAAVATVPAVIAPAVVPAAIIATAIPAAATPVATPAAVPATPAATATPVAPAAAATATPVAPAAAATPAAPVATVPVATVPAAPAAPGAAAGTAKAVAAPGAPAIPQTTGLLGSSGTTFRLVLASNSALAMGFNGTASVGVPLVPTDPSTVLTISGGTAYYSNNPTAGSFSNALQTTAKTYITFPTSGPLSNTVTSPGSTEYVYFIPMTTGKTPGSPVNYGDQVQLARYDQVAKATYYLQATPGQPGTMTATASSATTFTVSN